MNYLVALQKHFEVHKNESEASRMSAYMKGHFQYLGVKAPQRKKLLSTFLAKYGKPDRHEIEDVIIGLWSLPYREYQYCAIAIADKVLKKPIEKDILIVEYMLEYKQWWDTIDLIASHLVGNIFKKFDTVKDNYFKKWVDSPDMWLNRTAILFQLTYKSGTDPVLLEKAIIPHLQSSAFFHQKAIGWALRQYAKTNKPWVVDFLSNHEIKPLSMREATKHF